MIIELELKRQDFYEKLKREFYLYLSSFSSNLNKKESNNILLRFTFNKIANTNNIKDKQQDPIFKNFDEKGIAEDQVYKDLIFHKFSIDSVGLIVKWLWDKWSGITKEFQNIEDDRLIEDDISQLIYYFPSIDKNIIGEIEYKKQIYPDISNLIFNLYHFHYYGFKFDDHNNKFDNHAAVGKMIKNLINNEANDNDEDKNLKIHEIMKSLIQKALALQIRYNYLELKHHGLARTFKQMGHRSNDPYMIEGFASSFNHYFDKYCSAFPDLESSFGSLGSFFDACENFNNCPWMINITENRNETLENNNATVNISTPFDESLMAKMVKRVIDWCKYHDRDDIDNKSNKKKVTFIITMPLWKDLPCLDDIKSSKFTKGTIIYEKGKLPFINHMEKMGSTFKFISKSADNNFHKIVYPCNIIESTIVGYY